MKVWISRYRKQVIAALGVIGLICFTKFTIILIVVCVITYFYRKLMREKRVEEWEKRNVDPVEYRVLDKNIEKIAELIGVNDKNKSDYKFYASNMPYGRANAFLNYFQRDLMNEEIYYFSAIPSEKLGQRIWISNNRKWNIYCKSGEFNKRKDKATAFFWI